MHKNKLETWTRYHYIQVFSAINMAPTFLLVLVLAAVAAGSPFNNSLDIAFVEEHPEETKAAMTTRGLWPRCYIPYVIDTTLILQKPLIKRAMKEYQDKTCVKFGKRRGETNYINIIWGQGCYSYVGMANTGKQAVGLGAGCHSIGVILKELGHAIGLYNEHKRSDRDKYVTINLGNVKPGKEYRFDKIPADQMDTGKSPYDCSSIMQVGQYFLSKNNKPTIVAKYSNCTLIDTSQKTGLSRHDVEVINNLCNCKKDASKI